MRYTELKLIETSKRNKRFACADKEKFKGKSRLTLSDSREGAVVNPPNRINIKKLNLKAHSECERNPRNTHRVRYQGNHG